jgi:hypothetical protein
MSGATVPASADRPDRGLGDGGMADDDVATRARAVLDQHWRPPGFCVPNQRTYPWQWLWDSCFHALCWARLDRPDRARTELTNALSQQGDDGFVPHITYWSASGRPDDDTHAEFWGRQASSGLTQPPMYGHAVAELVRAGVDLPDDVIDRARRGLHFLFEDRHRPGVGPVIVHPWESGCDDSPRWDAWSVDPTSARPWQPQPWKATKGELVAAVRSSGSSPGGSPTGSHRFEVASAGFGALVAFNALELADVTGDRTLAESAAELVAVLDQRWSEGTATWLDHVVVGPDAGSSSPVESSGVRTADALLAVLVSARSDAVDAAFAQLADPTAFGAGYGPTGVHRAEPAFDPRTYWRGPAWPQLTYLLWLAARRRGRDHDAAGLAGQLVAGARRSGFAEYWHPDTGEGLGAIPQSWTALACLVT